MARTRAPSAALLVERLWGSSDSDTSSPSPREHVSQHSSRRDPHAFADRSASPRSSRTRLATARGRSRGNRSARQRGTSDAARDQRDLHEVCARLERTGARKDERIDTLRHRLARADAENAALRLELAQAALTRSGGSFGASGVARRVQVLEREVATLRAEARLNEARKHAGVLTKLPDDGRCGDTPSRRSAPLLGAPRWAASRASQRAVSAAELTPLERFVTPVVDSNELGNQRAALRRADVKAQLQATVELLDKTKRVGWAQRRS